MSFVVYWKISEAPSTSECVAGLNHVSKLLILKAIIAHENAIAHKAGINLSILIVCSIVIKNNQEQIRLKHIFPSERI